MNIIEKYEPINDANKLKALMDELKTIPGAMNSYVRQEIFINIKKAKLQMKFNAEYPESIFTDAGKFMPSDNMPPTDNANENTDNPKASSGEINTIEDIEKLVEYLPDETKGDMKSIYGTYIEMAFHNFYLTMNHIFRLTAGEDLMENAQKLFDKDNNNPDKSFKRDYANEKYVWEPMFKFFENEAQPEIAEKAEELFMKHFPILKALDTLKPEKRVSRIDALRKFSIVLRELRNFYSHYLFKPLDYQKWKYIKNEPFVTEIIEQLFEGAKREVKNRFAFDENMMEVANKFEPNHDRSIRDHRGQMVKAKRKANFKYELAKQKNGKRHLTPFGILFLTSQFLEKKYAKIFADKSHLIRFRDQAVICEMLSVYRIRLYVKRINVSKATDALALDIINELQRCPKTLFDMLSPTNQQRFRIKGETASDPEVLFVRKKDRFAHLLLKYIDDTRSFDNIRFQVSLGRYFFKFYDKLCIDTESEKRVRSLCKDINGFGRITEIEQKRKALWGDMIRETDDININTSDQKPYITDQRAKYLISDNKIAMYIRKPEDTSDIVPELSETGVHNVVPTCWLSTYELPALAMLIHLYDGDASRVEDIIKVKVSAYHRLFADIRDGVLKPVDNEDRLSTILKEYDIDINAIPRKMKDYLLMKDVSAKSLLCQWAKSELERMILQTEKRLEHIREDLKASSDTKSNKLGKKSFVYIKKGRIADFLAHDMMYFQPMTKTDNNKLTSLNFRILQSVLALYNGNFEELSRVLHNAHIIGKPNDTQTNPIVMAVCRKYSKFDSLTDFYIEYLKERKAFLEKCMSDNSGVENMYFLHPNQAKWDERSDEYYRSLASRYLHDEYGGTEFDKAIELPRGLFEPYIRKEFAEMADMKDIAIDGGKNLSYLIYGYLKRVMKDDTQDYYDSPRTYKLFNLLYQNSPRDPKIYMSPAEIRILLMRSGKKSIRKDIDAFLSKTTAMDRENMKERCTYLLRKMKDTETELKCQKTQDILLFLLAKRLLEYGSKEDRSVSMKAFDEIKLKDIARSNTLSQKISITIDIESESGKKVSLKHEDFKLKNYSQIYAITNDRRIPPLIDLIQSHTVNRSEIEDELKNYDKVHPEILASIFGFEKEYYKNHVIDKEQKLPELYDMLEDTLGKSYSTDEERKYKNKRKYEIRTIRNSFAHCTYPNPNDVANAKNIDLPQKANKLAETLKQHLIK